MCPSADTLSCLFFFLENMALIESASKMGACACDTSSYLRFTNNKHRVYSIIRLSYMFILFVCVLVSAVSAGLTRKITGKET